MKRIGVAHAGIHDGLELRGVVDLHLPESKTRLRPRRRPAA
jgi:hypothetical protein